MYIPLAPCNAVQAKPGQAIMPKRTPLRDVHAILCVQRNAKNARGAHAAMCLSEKSSQTRKEKGGENWGSGVMLQKLRTKACRDAPES